MMSNFEIIQIIFQGVTFIVFIISIFYAAKQIKLLIKSHADNHEWNRRIATKQECARNPPKDELTKAFNYPERNTPIPLNEMLEAFEENAVVREQCVDLLNYYQGLSSGVFLGIYDEVIVMAAWSISMSKALMRLQKFIEHVRSNGRPRAFSDMERLVVKWDKQEISRHDRDFTGRIG